MKLKWILSPFLLWFVFHVACSQSDVVSVDTIQDGGSFMVYCDASRMMIPSGVTDISSLTLHRKVVTSPSFTPVAQYRTSGSAPEFENIPVGRQWTINFSGANGGLNNRNTMKIEILVPDATCGDAGLYRCTVRYVDPSSFFEIETDSPEQSVTAEAGISLLILSLDPDFRTGDYAEYTEGTYLQMTCRVNGPQNLQMYWMTKSEFALSFTNYFPQNDMTDQISNLAIGGSCNEYIHERKLHFNVSQLNDGYTYKCEIRQNNVPVVKAISKNVTLGVKPISTSSSVHNQQPLRPGGGHLNVYCSASNVTISVNGVTDIASLSLYRQAGTSTSFTLLAQYHSYAAGNIPTEIRNIPNGRQWTIDFSGANGGVSNRDSMKIEMSMSDATCDDAGPYRCSVRYVNPDDFSETDILSPAQNLTAEVCSQLPVVSINTIKNGDSFHVYCDAKRVAVPVSDYSAISSLTLHRQVGTSTSFALVAQYKAYAVGFGPTEIMNIPSGRQWTINFSGANGGVSNRDSMKIEMWVPDATIGDAGLYRCTVRYVNPDDFSETDIMSPEQDVTAVGTRAHQEISEE